MAKIKTERCWKLEAKLYESSDGEKFIEIKEDHDQGDETQNPYVVIPEESIDELIYQLVKMNRTIKRGNK